MIEWLNLIDCRITLRFKSALMLLLTWPTSDLILWCEVASQRGKSLRCWFNKQQRSGGSEFLPFLPKKKKHGENHSANKSKKSYPAFNPLSTSNRISINFNSIQMANWLALIWTQPIGRHQWYQYLALILVITIWWLLLIVPLLGRMWLHRWIWSADFNRSRGRACIQLFHGLFPLYEVCVVVISTFFFLSVPRFLIIFFKRGNGCGLMRVEQLCHGRSFHYASSPLFIIKLLKKKPTKWGRNISTKNTINTKFQWNLCLYKSNRNPRGNRISDPICW